MIETIDKEIEGKTYRLSKFPAVAGREIVAKYPISIMPKIGDYAVSEETMLKLMAHVSVYLVDGKLQALATKELVNNHVPSWETLAKIEVAMMEYNCSFFQNGRILNFLEDSAPKALAWISKTLMGLLAQSSHPEKPTSTN